MFDELYYHHSGRFSVTGLLVGLIAGMLAAVSLAFVYSYATLYIPIVYASFLLVAAYGGAIGYATAASMARMKVRNGLLMMIVTSAAALVGLYFCWAIWLVALLRKSDVHVNLLSFVSQPDIVWRLILGVNKEGAWSMTTHGDPVTGIALWIVWAAEAAMIVGLPLKIARTTLSRPFCEPCESWCKEESDMYRSPVGDAELLKSELETKNFASLEPLGVAPADAQEWFQFDLNTCPNCSQTTTLTVQHVTETVNRKGEKTTKRRSIVNRLLLDQTQTQRLLQVCQRVAAAQKEPIQS